MIDYTITLGNMVEIGSIVLGGLYALATIKSNVGMLKTEVGKMQVEIEKLSEVVTQQAKAETRLDAMDTRLAGLDKDIRELRHGRGWVQNAVDGEYMKAGKVRDHSG